MTVLRTEGAYIRPYLGDILRAQSLIKLRMFVKRTLVALQRTGYVINQDKSQLKPTQDLVYIGGITHTGLGTGFPARGQEADLFSS